MKIQREREASECEVTLDEERTTEWRNKIIMFLITGREKCMKKGGENEGRGYKVES